MRLKTNSIVNANNDGPVIIPETKIDLNDSSIIISGNVEVLGITTVVGPMVASNASVGVITASSFVGDGSGLVAVPSVSISKSIALKYIISDPPLRS
jgi:hypothetical protein